MNFTPYQIIVPLIAIFMMAYAWGLTVRQKKTIWESTLWSIFWIGIATVAAFPQLLSYLSVITGIKNQVNAVLVTSIGILFFVVFVLILRLEELSHRQTLLVRKLALKDLDDNEKLKMKN